MRCFVKDHGARLAGQLLQLIPALLFAGGKKALKGEAACGQAGDSQRVDGGAAAGDSLHGDAVFGAQTHQLLAGITDGGHPRVGDQRAGLTGQQAGEDRLSRCGTVVLVIADQRLFDAEMIQQLHRDTGILSGNEIGVLQRFHGAGREVSQIADGGGHQI